MKTEMIALSALALLATSAVAHSEEQPTVVSGVMASKCSRLIEGMDDNVSVGRNPLAFAMLSWAEGYITATNLDLGEQAARFDLGSLSAMEMWASIYGFCKRNPDKIGAAAVIDVMSKLQHFGPEAAE